MKKNILIIIIIFLIFCFSVFFKSLNSPNTYKPSQSIGKKILTFKAEDLLSGKIVNSEELFLEDKIYLLNIWSSWCAPCRKEHKFLMKIKNNANVEVIGINYKDDSVNAKKFIYNLGNPYKKILKDSDGIISINLGAYGVPETLVINRNKIILNKIVGPIDEESFIKIQSLIK
tara:strand:- start:569 stop:1087 length:519 start_codon:yes stop_codon:yes gene_type:complete